MKYLFLCSILMWSISLSANQKEIDCLAKNIYFESRNQSHMGMLAVAWVTMNRVDDDRWPDTICKVVWDDNQFSWTHDGKSDIPREKQAWNDSLLIANGVYNLYHINKSMGNQLLVDITNGSVFYHSTTIDYPYWSDSYEYVMVIEEHMFYK